MLAILFCGNSNDPSIKKNLEKLKKFDLIFIDGDHSYNAVKNDFKLSLSLSHKKTVYIFHDIYHAESGSKKFWGELKKFKKYKLKEIISRNHNFKYGTGILTLK